VKNKTLIFIYSKWLSGRFFPNTNDSVIAARCG
jgi:hypothetical protein